MNPQSLKGGSTKPKPVSGQKSYAREEEAQRAWRALCSGSEDTETALLRYRARYGGIRPEAFDDSGRHKTRRGYEFLRGKSRKGAYAGGPLGRARVIAGRPLELRCIPFSAIPELKELEYDPFVQFEPGLDKLATDALKKHITGPALGCIENGRVNKANHFHVFVVPGSCKLGSSSGVIPDKQLPQAAAYLGKAPHWDFETALAYLTVRQSLLGKRVASRYFNFNLGNQRTRPITLAMIEEALGYSLAKPEAVEVPAVLVDVPSAVEPMQALADLPILRGATVQESEQVINLHRAWAEGRYDGLPLKLPGRSCTDLGRTLAYYFGARKRLFPAEVTDLVEIASALGLTAELPSTDYEYGKEYWSRKAV